MGPSCSSGTNGGGFFNVDSGPPLREPDGLTNLAVRFGSPCPSRSPSPTPSARWCGSIRHGAALLAAMVIIFGVWVGFTSYAEHQQNPAVVAAGVHSTVGNTEGKEVALR